MKKNINNFNTGTAINESGLLSVTFQDCAGILKEVLDGYPRF
jgi:hypothetical protein